MSIAIPVPLFKFGPCRRKPSDGSRMRVNPSEKGPLDCQVYVVAAKAIADDWPKGDCLSCGKPLREHEKRVSSLAPPGTGVVIDEALLRVG